MVGPRWALPDCLLLTTLTPVTRATSVARVSVRWVTAFLDLPAPSYDAGVRFWSDATSSVLSPPRGRDGEFATLLPEDGDAYLRVQRVQEGPGGVHLDLHVEDVTGFAWAAVSLGATEIARYDDLVVLTSPGRLPFCVVRWDGEAKRPSPYAGIVDQVCLDITPSHFDAEGAFWADVTGWEPRQGSRTEFVVLVRPPEQPLRLLLQRLDDERPGPVAAHLDLAAGGALVTTVSRLTDFGARALRDTSGWVTMRDPVGREFCVTRREPSAGLVSL